NSLTFSGRGIPPACVAPPSNTPGILGRHALSAGRRAPENLSPNFELGTLLPLYSILMQTSRSGTTTDLAMQTQAARAALDARVREVVAWHFDPATGCPFWLEYAQKLGWDPRREISGFSDLSRLGAFEDDWLRGGPVQRWICRGYVGKPVYVFETGG